MLHYCKKCGRIILLLGDWKRICDFCNIPVYPIPEEFVASQCSMKEELREQFIDEYIKSSPEFEPNHMALNAPTAMLRM